MKLMVYKKFLSIIDRVYFLGMSLNEKLSMDPNSESKKSSLHLKCDGLLKPNFVQYPWIRSEVLATFHISYDTKNQFKWNIHSGWRRFMLLIKVWSDVVELNRFRWNNTFSSFPWLEWFYMVQTLIHCTFTRK